MLDIRFIRENPEIVKKAVADKQLAHKVDIDNLLTLDTTYRELLVKVEEHRALRNQLSSDISKVEGTAREKLISEATDVKNELQEHEEKLEETKAELDALILTVPNLVADDVPYGKDENENVVLRTWGEKPNFNFTPKDHVDLGEALNIIDIETSAKVSGSRFNYLKNGAVLLQMALINYTFEILTNDETIKELCERSGNPVVKPFEPILPPVIIRGDVAKKMDRFDPIEDRYYLPEDDQMFVGSAEHSLGPMYMDETLDAAQLPIRYVGYSTAFRREAGSYGKDTRGILRRHQFDKLEMESFSLPEQGLDEQNLFIAVQEYICQTVGIPHEVMAICTGDMGKPDYRQVDINCWMPGQDAYRETHTSDYMTDFQARRLNIKFKREDGETGFVHMNDATAIAIGRLLIAIIENYQQEDGSIKVPEVLQKYMYGMKEIRA